MRYKIAQRYSGTLRMEVVADNREELEEVVADRKITVDEMMESCEFEPLEVIEEVKPKPKFRIAVSETIGKTYEIEADTLEEAIDLMSDTEPIKERGLEWDIVDTEEIK